jgi:hypothetical protein
MSLKTDLAQWMGLASVLAGLTLDGAAAMSLDGRERSSRTEAGVAPPGCAVTESLERDGNVDSIALVCSEAAYGRVLELDRPLDGSGPLAERWRGG